MHIEINQRFQEVASYKRDKLFPQEIDLALNKAMFRLLEKGVDSKFQDDQISLGHVNALIKKNKISELIVPSISDPLYEENLTNSYGTVPPDLYWLINGRAEILTDPLNCGIAPTLGTTTYSEWTAVVPFPTAGASPYFANITVTSSVLGTLYTAPSGISAGFNSVNSKYVLINNILELKHATVKVYWERYRDVYYKDSFIFVNSTNAGTIAVSGSNVTSSSIAMTQTTYSIYNRAVISAIESKEVTLAPVKGNEQDSLYSSLKQNQFYKTRSIEPVMDQTYDYFIIYRDESFLVTRFYYDYIRKPRTISLILNQSCELASSTHPKIIDLATEILRLDTKDQNYPQTVQDTQLRTN